MIIELEHIVPDTASGSEEWLVKIIKDNSLTICKITESVFEAINYLQSEINSNGISFNDMHPDLQKSILETEKKLS